jgi:hypothetical protein
LGFWFEFDPANKILLARFEGRLTDELLPELYEAIRKYARATDASAGILDFSAMSELAVSTKVVHQLANREPAMPDATTRPRFIVAPSQAAFGTARMFQLMRWSTRPLLKVVRTLDEAFAALGHSIPGPRTYRLPVDSN